MSVICVCDMSCANLFSDMGAHTPLQEIDEKEGRMKTSTLRRIS